MPDDLDELSGGLRRMLSTAGLAGKLGKKAAARVLFRGSGDAGVPAESSGTATEGSEAAIATARKLVAQMSQLKGLVMKAGQIASYMPGSMPPAAQQVLAELQASSTPMAYHRIDEMLVAELGAPGRTLFEAIDERPFAAASIGQVHRAVHGGAPVAVKVQYPGIEDAIRSDLRMVGAIARLSAIGSPLDAGALSGELRDRLLEECDYLREADNQRLFATLLASIDGAHVPEVVAGRSSRRVLTTALIDGAPIAAVADQTVRDRAGQVIFRACFELLFRRCIYNADPHPGNYLIDRAGGVTFLDFGCVRRFAPGTIATWKRMARAVIAGGRAGFEAGFRALGFVGKERKFDWDYQWNAMRFLYTPFLEPNFRYHPDYVRKTFGVLMFDNPNRTRIAMPPEWLFLNRLQWGLNAVLAQLAATGPWRETIDELLAAPLDPA
ncbi:MAG: AarF/ABC1/UbiB kinase family protein [Deltaproteobacteria bacterium]|nr:MAG: AarF/ABC1/UbiB kinase family protein [Deltaproteobacteria bacterium]TMQ13513.1 MAG: AarF/ABC1/UbiB kinase family protein [Deltaproteobacteria bacterium]